MDKLIWSPRALQDLDGICEFIARDSKQYAYLFAERIMALAESLSKQPLLGAIVPEYRQEDLRERLFQSYRLVYRVVPGRIEIVTIVHGARRLPDDLSR